MLFLNIYKHITFSIYINRKHSILFLKLRWAIFKFFDNSTEKSHQMILKNQKKNIFDI